MKKTIYFVLLFLASCLSINAEKSYVNVISKHSGLLNEYPDIYLSGSIPSNMDSRYYSSASSSTNRKYVGDVLNMLAQEGFVVEQQSACINSGLCQTFLLSKNSETPSRVVQSVKVDDEDVVEVARYNLQGIPVKENEKGVQIIVYSNYTTKTVIVQ